MEQYPYTCISCRVAFNDGEIQRQHYKTDWHKYNIKRKVYDYPPVTAEVFQQSVLLQRKHYEEPREEKAYCQTCRKSFNTQNAHYNHLNSKKHRDNLVNAKNDVPQKSKDGGENNSKTDIMSIDENDSKTDIMSIDENDLEIEEDTDSEEWVDDTENPIDDNNCLFCGHHSRTLVRNLKHMTVKHSFFVPDAEYCIDLRGLLYYLGENITQGFMCIWCNDGDKGKRFHSIDAVQKHMIDKGHCKMLHEGLALLECAPYYDYSSSYTDPPEEDTDIDTEFDIPVIDNSDITLTLPSGVVLDHRHLMNDYRKRTDRNRSMVPAAENKKLRKVLAQYRELGWTASQQEAVAKKARDLHFMKRMQAKSNMRLGVKANKFQKHYRAQVLF